MRRIFSWSQKHRRGSPTIEFILLVPCFILCLLLLWQLVILGLAMMQTQAVVRDVARVMAYTNDEEKAKEQAKLSFPPTSSYQMADLSVEKKNGEALVQIKTEVKLVLLQTPYRFHFKEQATTPLLDDRQQNKSNVLSDMPIMESITE
ncbi:TadE/TadG family type IV pilus assembly protein [Shimazuella kribbensis]|uniref:TadE/TadG family type IV pilus assembly protein n=1 Tax=Shimazuella kribbensis TaxID=139808 RepID=UPI00048FCC14|nr:TadE/TadG family type IV pilus assembly protein [Shimazuella kribbensis]